MAEYTIPKPYRDFYVTNPYIELKESNERLQRIVKGGYVATDSFEGTCEQVITFDKEKHGFSLTNDSSKASTWSMDLKYASLWEQGQLSTDNGSESNSLLHIRTAFIPCTANTVYTFSATRSENKYAVQVLGYDKDKKFVSVVRTWLEITSSPTFTLSQDSTIRYVRLSVSDYVGFTNVTPQSFVSDITAFTISVTSYTAPSDLTVKVAENVAGLPTTADGWEMGGITVENGTLYDNTKICRTINPFEVKPNKNYRIKMGYPDDSTCRLILYEYTKTGVFIGSTQFNGLIEIQFKTRENTGLIKFVTYTTAWVDTTVAEIFAAMKYIVMTSEPMIVQKNDTRIVTMPPFTSLYIESNVPYHGHALDLAE